MIVPRSDPGKGRANQARTGITGPIRGGGPG